MNSARIYKMVIVILVLLNVTILGFFWLNRPPKHGPPTPITEIISFDKKVKSQISELEKAHHIRKRKLMRQSRDLHQEFYADMNRTKAEELVYLQKIGAVQMVIDQMTYDFFQEIMHLCTEAQKVELKKIIKGAIQNFDRPKPPRK
jgi:hypothetical protein